MNTVTYTHKLLLASLVGISAISFTFAETENETEIRNQILRTKKLFIASTTASTTLRERDDMKAEFEAKVDAAKKEYEDKKEEREGKRVDAMKTKSTSEIDKRVTSLNELLSRVATMKNLSPAFVQSLTTNIQATIASLNELKTKVAQDTGTTTTKQDKDSITKSYRVYALVLPQARIAASADKITSITTMMNTVADKLAVRMASSTGDMTAAQAALADYKAKIIDANKQAAEAVSITKNLVPDNGDKTVMQTNMQALKKAQELLRLAEKDVKDARKDINIITKALRKIDGKADKKDQRGYGDDPRKATTTASTTRS